MTALRGTEYKAMLEVLIDACLDAEGQVPLINPALLPDKLHLELEALIQERTSAGFSPRVPYPEPSEETLGKVYDSLSSEIPSAYPGELEE